MKTTIKKIVTQFQKASARMRELMVGLLTQVNLRKGEAKKGDVVVTINAAESTHKEEVFKTFAEAKAAFNKDKAFAFDPHQKKRKSKPLRKRNKTKIKV